VAVSWELTGFINADTASAELANGCLSQEQFVDDVRHQLSDDSVLNIGSCVEGVM
jgi:hypothetical protein